MENNTLSHAGIKGMKWGVRRYQNKDGTLTEAGKKRYNRAIQDAKDLAESHAYLEDTTRRLQKGWDGKSQILVPTEVKKAYKTLVETFIMKTGALHQKYADVRSSVVTEKGKDYVVALLEDKVTGSGYEYKVELHEQNK